MARFCGLSKEWIKSYLIVYESFIFTIISIPVNSPLRKKQASIAWGVIGARNFVCFVSLMRGEKKLPKSRLVELDIKTQFRKQIFNSHFFLKMFPQAIWCHEAVSRLLTARGPRQYARLHRCLTFAFVSLAKTFMEVLHNVRPLTWDRRECRLKVE